MINVLAISKQEEFVEFIQMYVVNPSFKIVQRCSTLKMAIEALKELQPDIIFMDAVWDEIKYGMTGSTFVKKLLEQNANEKIIIVTNTLNTGSLINKYRELGVKGYYYRNMDKAIPAFINCIEEVYKGNEWFP